MNSAKWDAIAEAFDAGTWIPANGWDAWNAQAVDEATTIRAALPAEVGTLLEVGCGVARLTPYLALMFPSVVATDTSAACLRVTRKRCQDVRNVTVIPAEESVLGIDAALVWCLYDEDWPEALREAHRRELRADYPLVLEGDRDRWMRYKARPPIEITTFEK